MTYDELLWLAKQASKHHTIVEVGSYHGRSTRALADNTEGIVYAIDDFKGPRDKQNLPNAHFETFINNTIDLIQQNRVVPVVADHTSIALDVRPDMVFIDGSHVYEDVKRDIEFWKARILPGGLLCGHDFTNIKDVDVAVRETMPKFKVARRTSIWYSVCV